MKFFYIRIKNIISFFRIVVFCLTSKTDRKNFIRFNIAFFLQRKKYYFHGALGDIYHAVNYIEDKFKGKYDDAIVMVGDRAWDITQFFKTQNYDFNNFLVAPRFFLKYLKCLGHGLEYSIPIWKYLQEIKWKERKIKISDNLEKQIFINPTSNYLKIKTSKNFWLQLAEKLQKETDYKVIFRSHSPNPEKFKDYSDTKIHDLFLNVFGKNTIVLGIRSGFTDLLKTCDLKKILLLQSEKDFYEQPFLNFSKNKNYQMFMKADFEYILSEHFGEKDIEKIIASILEICK